MLKITTATTFFLWSLCMTMTQMGHQFVYGQLPSCNHPEETYLIVRVHRSTTPVVHCTDFWDDPDTYVDVNVKGTRSKQEDIENRTQGEIPASREKIERKQRTNRVENHIKPKWDSTLDFGCVPRESEISFEIVDYDSISDSDSCLGPLKVSSKEWPKVNKVTEICNNDNDCLEYSLLYTDADVTPDKTEEDEKKKKTPEEQKQEEEEEDKKTNPTPGPDERRGDIEPSGKETEENASQSSTSSGNTSPENLTTKDDNSDKAGDIGIAMGAVGAVLIVFAIFAVVIIKRRQKDRKTDRMLSNLGAPNDDDDGVDPEDVTL